ncbi:glycosyltransferase family 2 protein [Citrobacter sp. 50677481]|uniref:glycosyltransferase family 2 protein n=1 Tax=Citrobacter sp. 50677481 TaxID=1736699 RepID=UPI00092F80E2|nr:glycosyltransferase family 2 protein [Citrobacter sp. 50677481]HCQ7754735.1 glycosyltransferase family 2 protein [Citrobacter sedlakii]
MANVKKTGSASLMDTLMKRQKTVSPRHTPFISVVCPTYNRREFLPYLLYMWQYQDYPAEKRELVILDDSAQSNADLIAMMVDPACPNVRYIHSEERLVLGQKRNMLNELAKGEYILCFDDDDYYPPNKISHQVAQMQENNALFSGTDRLYIWYSHLNKIYLTHAFGPRHALNGTFGFHRNFLKKHRYDDTATRAEETSFLNGFTTPVLQIDPKQSILCISHSHNTYDKDFVMSTSTPVDLTIEDFVSDPNLLAHYRRLSHAPINTQVNWAIFEKIAVLFDGGQASALQARCEALMAFGVRASQIWPVEKQTLELETHCQVLEEAQQQGWRNVLLLDADIQFVKKENTILYVNKLLNGLEQVAWHGLTLGARYENFTPMQSMPGVARIFNAGCGCAYAINAPYYGELLSAYRQGMAQDVNLDRCWAGVMGRGDVWLGFSPGFAFLQLHPDPKSGEVIDCTHWFFRKHR